MRCFLSCVGDARDAKGCEVGRSPVAAETEGVAESGQDCESWGRWRFIGKPALWMEIEFRELEENVAVSWESANWRQNGPWKGKD